MRVGHLSRSSLTTGPRELGHRKRTSSKRTIVKAVHLGSLSLPSPSLPASPEGSRKTSVIEAQDTDFPVAFVRISLAFSPGLRVKNLEDKR